MVERALELEIQCSATHFSVTEPVFCLPYVQVSVENRWSWFGQVGLWALRPSCLGPAPSSLFLLFLRAPTAPLQTEDSQTLSSYKGKFDRGVRRHYRFTELSVMGGETVGSS